MSAKIWMDRLATVAWKDWGPRPSLLFGVEGYPEIRRRVEAHPDFLRELRTRCQALIETPPDRVNFEVARPPALEAYVMAQGAWLGGPREWGEWSKARFMTMLEGGCWMPPVHQGFCRHYDHVMGNVAAVLALTHDLLDGVCTAEEGGRLTAGMRRRVLEPFLAATRDRAEWWSQAAVESNWKIMTCGETGLALCAYAAEWPESREALAYAVRGVVETLDRVAPEGDWPEGVAYWMATLFMGLRFARALRRLTGGAVDLMEHPALKCTGDFPFYLTMNSGAVYNFNDNPDSLDYEEPADGLRILAAETGRADWAALARRYRWVSLLSLALEAEAGPVTEPPAPPARAKAFPRTGVALLRAGWAREDLAVGFKCGPSDVGHSHLDANSWVLEAGGQPLAIDTGWWSYATFIGFFDLKNHRWNWDCNATVGHNSVLVDGQGQTWGGEYPGRLGALTSGPGWQMISGDASRCYPGRLTRFIRTLCLLPPDRVIIRDVIECVAPSHLEWLLHYAGAVRDAGAATIVEHQGVTLAVTPFLPGREFGWRVSDVVRTSEYPDAEYHVVNRKSIRYRSFAPFRSMASAEFLFGLQVGGVGAADWSFQGGAEGWFLQGVGDDRRVTPDGEGLRIERTGG